MKTTEAHSLKTERELDEMLVNLDGLDDKGIEARGRELYNELYMTSNRRGDFQTHDGERVVFWKDRFDHAFYEAADWKVSSAKTVIAKARVARIRWIGEMIAGNVRNSECWLIPQDSRPDNRLYVTFQKGYVVWLELRDAGGWKFSTAYNADAQKIRTYTKRRGAVRIWKHGQK